MKLLSALFLSSLAINCFAAHLTPIQKYLRIVYPTSPEIGTLNAKQAQEFYTKQLNFWFRVPTKKHPNGLFSKVIKPYYGIFLFPDTTATDGKAGILFGQNGILSDKPFHGSNKNHIEVTSFGWMMFPYGGFFNWAPGSGIYLNTGGKVIQAYTRIDLLYKIYKAEHNLKKYYQMLSFNKLVNEEIYGVSTGLTLALKSRICNNSTYKTKLPTLISGLQTAGQWNSFKSPFCNSKFLKQSKLVLLKQYVQDHVAGKFKVSKPRFAYMEQEATAALDQWGYILAKAAGYYVIEYTKAPNSGGTTNFEIDDLRWPEVENVNAGNNAMYDGTQRYDLKYVWQKAIDNGWLEQRDPFDLDNNKYARKINMQWPKMLASNCAYHSGCEVRDPSSFFPKNWLPNGQWNLKVCKRLGCFPTEKYSQWKHRQACPAPLVIKSTNNLCHLVSFALNSTNNGSFSMIDPAINKQFLNAYKSELVHDKKAL